MNSNAQNPTTTVTESAGSAEFTPGISDLKTAIPVDTTFLQGIADASLTGHIQNAAPTLTHNLPSLPGQTSTSTVSTLSSHYEFRLLE